MKIMVRVRFLANDMWIGVYWNYIVTQHTRYIDLFTCILPMFPIHINIQIPINK